jgi:hypothetical protein
MIVDSDDEEIAPAVAGCHAPRKTGRGLKKAMLMRFKKNGMVCEGSNPRINAGGHEGTPLHTTTRTRIVFIIFTA